MPMAMLRRQRQTLQGLAWASATVGLLNDTEGLRRGIAAPLAVRRALL